MNANLPGSFLDPTILVLALLTAVFVYFLLGEDSEKWYWRAYFWSVTAVNLVFGLFGPDGYIFGIAGVLVALWVYFVTFQKRQFTMRDMLLYVLILGCMCTQIASGYSNHPEDWNYRLNQPRRYRK